ncbi:nuclear transport factor 2 family protein [Actinomadura rugatobispora]|uniref:Nuclear transport factor 2 family protein n=1 Tax=Actinomadura rugatobispora TaxID=1994 RepID=A0ABW0ZP96_9ACTN|nr:nuclear transport factor 2 family protein [Actinomadura rugatobispora]
MTTSDTVPRIIQRYFELASSQDNEAYLALFTADALVEDEGREYAGINAVQGWRSRVPVVEHTITDVEPADEGLIVTCTITGDFPGSPLAGLRFHFQEFDENHVKVLRIRP